MDNKELIDAVRRLSVETGAWPASAADGSITVASMAVPSCGR